MEYAESTVHDNNVLEADFTQLMEAVVSLYLHYPNIYHWRWFTHCQHVAQGNYKPDGMLYTTNMNRNNPTYSYGQAIPHLIYESKPPGVVTTLLPKLMGEQV
jgi:hypothetical protein